MPVSFKSLFVFSLLVLTGCTTVPTPSERQKTADKLAEKHAWQSKIISTPEFNLMSYQPAKIDSQQRLLTVYIEGDGLAWLTSSQPSRNPTPINPLGLKLALLQPSGNVAYLARPCQFLEGANAKNCSTTYWTNKRFSPEIITAENAALDKLKSEFGAALLQLIGYSGGGAIATLLAERRTDVVKLITVAGNLDHDAWTKLHKITPLSGSLNPADQIANLSHIEQVHFVGEKDQVIPPVLPQTFVAKLPANTPVKVVVVPNQTHSCCWDQVWPALLSSMDHKK